MVVKKLMLVVFAIAILAMVGCSKLNIAQRFNPVSSEISMDPSGECLLLNPETLADDNVFDSVKCSSESDCYESALDSDDYRAEPEFDQYVVCE